MKQNSLINDESTIGNRILAYLADHPTAQDTLEGIVEWWLLEREIKFQTAKVKEAISALVAKGLILEKKGPGSQIHYRINHSKVQRNQEARRTDEMYLQIFQSDKHTQYLVENRTHIHN